LIIVRLLCIISTLMDFYFHLLQAVVALFIIVDPLGNLPVFVGLTEGLSRRQRHDTFMEALYIAFLLLLLFTIAGAGILDLFRVSLADFKIAGGLLLLVIALNLLTKGNIIEVAKKHQDIGAVPLGCPLLVGPGAITTALVLLGMYGMILTLLAVLINFIISGIILYWADNIYDKIGKTGSVIIAKVMAIIIAAIAVKFIREGVATLFLLYS
jgi:multiple antibiotic resistance protein